LSVNPSLNVRVGRMDETSLRGFLRNNQRDLMRALSDATRQGAHLGLRAFR
jgi:hypothetical protein